MEEIGVKAYGTERALSMVKESINYEGEKVLVSTGETPLMIIHAVYSSRSKNLHCSLLYRQEKDYEAM